MTLMELLGGEEGDKFLLVLAVRRDTMWPWEEDERKYREALGNLKLLQQVNFREFSDDHGESLSREDRMTVNGMQYFVYETSKEKKSEILRKIKGINDALDQTSINEELKPLENSCFSRLIGLYRK